MSITFRFASAEGYFLMLGVNTKARSQTGFFKLKSQEFKNP